MVAGLDRNLNILQCLSIIKRGNCFISRPTRLPKLQVFGRPFSARLKIYTKPWLIKIYFTLPRYKWWLKLRYNSIVIPIDPNNKFSVTTIQSQARDYGKFLGTLRAAKTELQLQAFVRWDCTSPTYSQALRTEYNTHSPNSRYNAVFYKLKVRIEVKNRRFWIVGGYRCWKCKTIFLKKGILDYSPRKCIIDTNKYLRKTSKFAWATKCKMVAFKEMN